MRRGIFSFLLLALLAGCAPRPTRPGQDLNLAFLDMMVPHHQGAVAMAQIALERAEHAEVKALAKTILAHQGREIEDMKYWKQLWYRSTDTPPLNAMPMIGLLGPDVCATGRTMDMQASVDALENAPEPFDLAFIDAMIPHHQMAVDAARLLQDADVRRDVRRMAKHVVTEQNQEIEQMRAWRAAWYPGAPPAP